MSLEELRQEIDRVNQEIADAVAERMDIVERIGEYKQENDMEMKDERREEVVKQQFEQLFSERDLPSRRGREFAEKLIEMALEEERE